MLVKLVRWLIEPFLWITQVKASQRDITFALGFTAVSIFWYCDGIDNRTAFISGLITFLYWKNNQK
ncbi:MAG: hypothetical protein GY866_36470 [Proteobacteria bacterium]|nr:hypothetical protein [Pseudomonadota bacterium]